MLLKAENLSMSFGGFRAVSGVSLQVAEGDIVGLIGPNGAGKSTFFNCLTGELTPTGGSVFFDDIDVTRASPEEHARLGIGRTYQVPATFERMTVLENVMVGAFLRHPDRDAARAAALQVLDFTGLDERADHPAKGLGTPGRKRLEIARALAMEPRLLLLDEALAGLTPVEMQDAIELVRQIHQRGITLLIVEHIMEVILSLTRSAIVFHHGQIIAGGHPEEVVNNREVVEAYLGHSREDQRLQRRRAKRSIRREKDLKASLGIEHLQVRYGDLVGVADVSVRVPEGAIVALLGSNGAGKTTTLNAVAGLVRPSAGTIRWQGDSIEHLDAFSIVRRGLSLSPEGWRLFAQQTVAQNLLLGATALRDRKRIPELLEKVYTLFPNLAHRKKQRASTLSGGERQMLALGRALMSEPRLLLLDEPSLGLGPAIIEDLYETLLQLHDGGLTLLLAEQSVQLALEVADYAYVLQTGRTVLEGPAEELGRSSQVQQIYLGLNGNAAAPS